MGTWRGEERGAVAGAAGVVAAPCVSLKIKLKKHVLRVIENAFHRKGNYFPPPQNNLTDVFSTVLKHVVNYSQEANGVQVSESVRALRPAFAGLRPAGPPRAPGVGFCWSAPVQGGPCEPGLGPGAQT